MYLAWFDADRKKPVSQKIAEAHQRYVEKFGRQPQVCLVNPEDAVAGTVVELRPLKHIGRHCFWIGVDDAAEHEPEVAPAPAAQPARRRVKGASPVEVPPPPVIAAAPLPELVAPPAKARRPRRERTAA